MPGKDKTPAAAETWQSLVGVVPKDSDSLNPGDELWANDLYLVIKSPMPKDVDSDLPSWHLSIRRADRGTARDWRHFQRIKNQLCGPEYEGMEIYPAESRLVDTSNQYHLWCVPFKIPVGFPGRLVMEDTGVENTVQRPFVAIDLSYGGLTSQTEFKEQLRDAAARQVRGARRAEREQREKQRRGGHDDL